MSARIKDTLFRLLRFDPQPGLAVHTPADVTNRTTERISLGDIDRPRNSPSYRKLLAEFVLPNSPDTVGRSPYWKEVFREPVKRVLRELKMQGILIEPNNPRARMCFDRDESDLRMLCLEHGLPTMGSADQLADRLLKIDPTAWLLGYAGELLQCSELAAPATIERKRAVTNSPLLDPDLRGLFTQDDFAVQRYLLQRPNGRTPSDNEVIWEMLKGRADQTAREGNLVLCRNVHVVMADHLVRRKKLAKALQAQCVVCVFDLCGARNRGDSPAHARSAYSRFDAARASLAPWLVRRISGLIREMDLSMDEIREIFLRVGVRLKVPKDSLRLWAVVKLALEGRLDSEDEIGRGRVIRSLLS